MNEQQKFVILPVEVKFLQKSPEMSTYSYVSYVCAFSSLLYAGDYDALLRRVKDYEFAVKSGIVFG